MFALSLGFPEFGWLSIDQICELNLNSVSESSIDDQSIVRLPNELEKLIVLNPNPDRMKHSLEPINAATWLVSIA